MKEVVRISKNDITERTNNFNDDVEALAQIVGIGAVKYADLSMNRESNYKFSYERMLSLNGNTAPYILYAYACIRGILRKASDTNDIDNNDATIVLVKESEVALVRNLFKLHRTYYEVE